IRRIQKSVREILINFLRINMTFSTARTRLRREQKGYAFVTFEERRLGASLSVNSPSRNSFKVCSQPFWLPAYSFRACRSLSEFARRSLSTGLLAFLFVAVAA